MNISRVQRVAAIAAATLLTKGDETAFLSAKREAARRLGLNPNLRSNWPPNRAIVAECVRIANRNEFEV